MKSSDVTIQMKALCLYCHIVLFVFQNVTKWNLQTWSKFAFGYIWQWKGLYGLFYVSVWTEFDCNNISMTENCKQL